MQKFKCLHKTVACVTLASISNFNYFIFPSTNPPVCNISIKIHFRNGDTKGKLLNSICARCIVCKTELNAVSIKKNKYFHSVAKGERCVALFHS